MPDGGGHQHLVAGLDLGRHTGYALVGSRGEVIDSGRWDLGSGGRVGQPYLSLQARLQSWLVPPADASLFVAYENVNFMAMKDGYRASQRWGGYEGIVTAFCERHKIRYSSAGPSTIRAQVMGKGKGHAKKPEVWAYCERLLGRRVATDDEADAILTGLWGTTLLESRA